MSPIDKEHHRNYAAWMESLSPLEFDKLSLRNTQSAFVISLILMEVLGMMAWLVPSERSFYVSLMLFCMIGMACIIADYIALKKKIKIQSQA